MIYEGTVYRPPSEAESLIFQVSIGCSHNACTFCSMYKEKDFRIKPVDQIVEEIRSVKAVYPNPKRVFLADGNAMSLKTEDLESILTELRAAFPSLSRISAYCAPADALAKTEDQLMRLKELGLDLLYLGIESGADAILARVEKGVTAEAMVMAGRRIKASGIGLSVTVISGLGGEHHFREHALATAKVLSAVQPDYIGLLTLLLEPGTRLFEEARSGAFIPATPETILEETACLVAALELNGTVFRSNHASNYLPLSGTLPQDKERILATIAMAQSQKHVLRQERFRSL